MNQQDDANEQAETRALKDALTQIDATPEPSPFLLHRTLAKIDAFEREQVEAPAWRRALGWWGASPIAARAVIAVQAAAIVALVAAVTIVPRQSREFQTLSAPADSTPGPRLAIAFQPGVSEEALRQLLREVEATIVDGPSALGLYTVRLPAAADADQVLARLRARADLVRFAETKGE